MCSRSQVYTSSTVSYLAAPSFSSAGCDVFIAPQPSEEELQVPCCHPYGVQAMRSERSRHRRLGTAPGSLLGRLSSSPCVSCVPAAVPPVGHQPRRRTHAAAPPNQSSTLGRHWVPTADRPDAFKDRCSTSLAVAHLRNDDHPTQPHGIVTTLKRWACGWELYRLVWFQTASSIEACSDHV